VEVEDGAESRLEALEAPAFFWLRLLTAFMSDRGCIFTHIRKSILLSGKTLLLGGSAINPSLSLTGGRQTSTEPS